MQYIYACGRKKLDSQLFELNCSSTYSQLEAAASIDILYVELYIRNNIYLE